MQVIVYARYSDPTQSRGDSIARQTRAAAAYIAAKNWTHETTIIDDGRSGFKGTHRTKGELGRIEQQARDGELVGKVLLVEQLSRLSREDYSDTYDLVRALMKSGVTVATVEGDRIYQAYGSISFDAVIELLVRAKMVHEESASKSRHALSKWDARRDAMAAGKIVTKACPPWLSVPPDRSNWIVDEERAAIVRRIYDWADSGLGSHRIVNNLNRDAIAPWPRYAGREPSRWSRGTITRMLTNRAVTGEHQPNRYEAGERVAAGEPIANYYPRIVQPDQFARVSAAATDRKTVRGNKGDVPNLFAGLCVCAVCGGKMQFKRIASRDAVRVRDGKPIKTAAAASLRCMAGLDGKCENTRSIAYVSLEKAMIRSALHLAMDDGAFSRKGEVVALDIKIADRQRDHDVAYAKAVALWEEADSAIAITLAKKREAEAAEIAAEIVELKAMRAKAAGQVSAAEQLSRLDALRDDLASDDIDKRTAARTKVAQGFRSIVSAIECQTDGKSVVRVVGNGRAITVFPGRGRREPEVWDFNLRKDSDDLTAIEDQKERKYRERDRLSRTGSLEPIPRTRTYNGRVRA